MRGTPGEKYHQKQLIRQLPAHDVDMMYCNELSEEEAKQMELFAKMRKEKCVGRGEVRTKNDGTAWVWIKLSTLCTYCGALAVSPLPIP